MKTETNSDAGSGCPAAPCSAFAEELATRLLTVMGPLGGIECTRAQMMLKRDDGTEQNYGGRNKRSIMLEIDELLAEKGFLMPNAQADPAREKTL